MYRVVDEFGGATLRSRAAAEAWLVRYFLHASANVSDIATLVGLPAAVAPAPPMSDPQFDEHVAEWALGEAEEGPRARAHSWAAQLTCAVEGEAAACAQTADELGAAVTSVEDAIAVLTDVSSTVVRCLSGALHRTCNDLDLNTPAAVEHAAMLSPHCINCDDTARSLELQRAVRTRSGCLQINLALMEETQIAQHVTRLKDHRNRDIQQKAVALCQRWWRLSSRARELAVMAADAELERASPSHSPVKRQRVHSQ